MAKVLYEILENGDSTVDLDKIEGGYKQYIHVRLNNIIKIYNKDTKKFDKTNNYYPLKRCEESNFEKNDYELQYFKLKSSRAQYCIDQLEDVYLQGTRDSEVLKQDHAYLIFETWRCHDTIRVAGDPVCKPNKMMYLKDGTSTASVAIETLVANGADLSLYDEDMEDKNASIDNWVRYKKIALKIINQKIDFTTFNEYAVRYNELFAPSIPMAYPSYSDTGYRFRYNIFGRADGYLYPINSDNVFFDYFHYGSDTF